MSKQDVLDKQLAQRFAWRIGSPGDLSDMEGLAPPVAPPEARPPEEEAAIGEQGRAAVLAERACADMAKQVARVWGIAPAARQAAATALLLENAEALGFDLAWMRAHPLEAVRLFRLVVRHYSSMPRRERRSGAHTLSFMPLSPREREVADLLVEAAEAGDGWLALMLDQSGIVEAAGRRYPELGERLARVLDEGTSWEARAIAAGWLAGGELRGAIPALRRALRLPHARVRWTAIEALLAMTPPALTEDDVLWLLEDAVEHPLSRGDVSRSLERIQSYEDTLIAAVAKVRPAEGFRPLERIADGGGVHVRKHRDGLDAGWALRALAAGYPERALARIDLALARSWSIRRWDAVEAAALLPDDLARPRLIEAAAGPSHYAAERAKQRWFERFGSACPVDPLMGVPTFLLAAKPSEALFARLVVLRGASDEAAGALLSVLLAGAQASPAQELSEADREALALLLFSLRDFGAVHRRAGLPSGEEAWASRLIERFGAPALDGLLALAARGACAGADHEWLGALASLARKGVVAGAYRDKLRDLAAEALGSPAWDGATSPLVALAIVGPPKALHDRLWAIALRPLSEGARERRFAFAVHWAMDALCAVKDAPALDERIAAAVEEALRGRSYAALERLVNLGCRRQVQAVFALVARCLAALDEDPALLPVASLGAHMMLDAGRIDEAWALEGLCRPESLVFTIAARICRSFRSPAVLAALEGALSSPARGGAAAAEAAEALVALDALGAEDARLGGILDRAPERERAALVGMLLRCGAPIAPLQKRAVALLASPDEDAAEEVLDALYMKRPEGMGELFDRARALGPSPSIVARLKQLRGEPSDAELYWRDREDEDDDEDDEGEEELA